MMSNPDREPVATPELDRPAEMGIRSFPAPGRAGPGKGFGPARELDDSVWTDGFAASGAIRLVRRNQVSRTHDLSMTSFRHLCLIVAVTALPACRSSTSALELEEQSPATSQGRLIQDLGIETLGGVFTPLLTSGQTLPCEFTETFSTAADNQEQVEVRLFRGTAKLTRDATLVGRFVIDGLPKLPRGTPNVAVTFSVTANGTILVKAREKSGHPVRLRRSDG